MPGIFLAYWQGILILVSKAYKKSNLLREQGVWHHLNWILMLPTLITSFLRNFRSFLSAFPLTLVDL